MKHLFHWTVIAPLLALAATPAFAYVGPGAGLSLLGALWGLLLAVLTALVFLALWPIRQYRKKARLRRAEAESQNTDVSTTTAQSTAHSHDTPAKSHDHQ